MKLIFGTLAVFVAAMVLLAGSGGIWLSSSTHEQTKQQSLKTLAEGLAYNISSQMQLFEQIVAQMASDEEVLNAIETGDPALTESTGNRLQKILPVALKIRLLPANINSIDERQVPVLGYADLEMIKKTLIAKQPSIIQGEGASRHLAITAPVTKGNQVIGVVLASLKFDFLKEFLAKAPIGDDFIEILQNSVSLGFGGKPETKTDNAEQLNIANSLWHISYSTAVNQHNLANIGIMLGIVIVLATLACGALFLGYYYTTRLLKKDQNTVLEAIKNVMTGKEVGIYAVKLSEMQVIISTVVQFRRIVDNKNAHQVEEKHEEHSHLNLDALLFADDEEKDNEKVEIKKSGPGLFKKKKLAKPIAEAKPKVKPNPVSSEKTKPEAPAQIKTETIAPINAKTTTPTNPTTQPALPPHVSTLSAEVENIFKAYDIRGIVGKGINKEIIYDLGLALGSEAKLKGVKTIVVARDGRLSSSDLSDGLIKGILSTGRRVFNLGIAPTPVLYFVTHHTEGRTGVMLTGSHNPANYNGLKMVMQGETLAHERIQQLKERLENEDYITEAMGTVEVNDDYAEEYIGTICDDVQLNRKLKVVVDCGNGVTGKLAPALLKALDCEVIELFCEIDGKFPNHHPDPSKAENLNNLIATVASQHADIGLAFDGDGDRLGVVDSNGKIIWPDRQMMLYAKKVLSIKPGAEIIFDVKCSRHLPAQIRKFGGRPVMWKCGHSLMKAKLKETGAALAGEMTGHIFFNDRWFGFDDALYTAARLLEILAADDRTSSEVFADFPDSINTPEISIALAEGENFSFMADLIAKARFPDAQIIDIDGLRVDFKDGWGLVRASNTTPTLVMRFEADNKEALDRIQQQFKQLMQEVKADIDLPF